MATVGKPFGSGGRKLSISLSVNLSEDGDVQRAEVALQLAAFSLRSPSRGEEEEDDDDGMPQELLLVSRGPDKGSPVGGDGDAGEFGGEEDGDEPAAVPDKLASLQDKDSSCIRGQHMGCYG